MGGCAYREVVVRMLAVSLASVWVPEVWDRMGLFLSASFN